MTNLTLSLAQIRALRAAREGQLRKTPSGSWCAHGRTIPGNSVSCLRRRGWIEAGTDTPTSTVTGDLILGQLSGRIRVRTTREGNLK